METCWARATELQVSPVLTVYDCVQALEAAVLVELTVVDVALPLRAYAAGDVYA